MSVHEETALSLDGLDLQAGAAALATEADTLRFLTCGSADDGKSTLLGRLLYDAQLLLQDQVETLEADTERHGKAGGTIDFALLFDGLEAEREQGITIDVAYRFFATPRRRFIVADAPGHEQYTRNMATGASTADLAVLLVDATRGLSTQTRRHATIVSMLGIREVVLAINKMDLVGYSESTFAEIREGFEAFAADLGFASLRAIPLSARVGDNVALKSTAMDWYPGPTLLEHLETIEIAADPEAQPFRLPVQWVIRPDRTFRGFAGRVASGAVAVGDEVAVASSGRSARVAEIRLGNQAMQRAVAGQSIAVTLDHEIDISRGDMLVASDDRPQVTDQFAADLVWIGDEPLLPGRPYLLKTGVKTVPAQVTDLKYELQIDSGSHEAAKTLAMNGIGMVNISTGEPIAVDAYRENRDTGSFILIDQFTNATVGAGMVAFSLRRATNIHWQALDIDRTARAALKHQKPAVLWFTGLSGSGKSTVANLVEKKLFARGRHTYTLDGDNVRHGLNRDLGFTDADRVENIRRVAETARLMADAGLIVLVSFISPFRSERALARSLMGDGEFLEIFVDAPLSVCQARDPKGLYARAAAGEIKNFTGIDSPYEPPEEAEVVLAAGATEADELADQVIAALDDAGRLSRV